MTEAWRDEARFKKIGDLLYGVPQACDTPNDEKTAFARAARRIDHAARIEECEQLLAQFDEVEFSCRCRSGQHPPSCPVGWAHKARAALQHKIDALRQAQEDQA